MLISRRIREQQDDSKNKEPVFIEPVKENLGYEDTENSGDFYDGGVEENKEDNTVSIDEWLGFDNSYTSDDGKGISWDRVYGASQYDGSEEDFDMGDPVDLEEMLMSDPEEFVLLDEEQENLEEDIEEDIEETSSEEEIDSEENEEPLEETTSEETEEEIFVAQEIKKPKRKKIKRADFGFSKKGGVFLTKDSFLKYFLSFVAIIVAGEILAGVIGYLVLPMAGLGQYAKFMFIVPPITAVVVIIAVYLKHPVRITKKRVLEKNADTENSRFMTEDEIVNADKFDTFYLSDLMKENHGIESGILLSANKNRKGDDVLITLARSIHAMVIGTTGSGKTTGYIQPMLEILTRCEDKPSIILPDPKGELYQWHKKTFEEQGYRVVMIDFQELYGSNRWNPLDYTIKLTKEYIALEHSKKDLKPAKDRKYHIRDLVFNTYQEAMDQIEAEQQELKDQVFLDLQDIIQSVFPVEKQQGGDTMWAETAQSAIFAMLYGMWEDMRDEKLPAEKFILYNLIRNVNDYYRGKCEDFERYIENKRAVDKDSATIVKSKPIMDSIKSERTLASYLTSISNHTEFFADEGILALTSSSDIDMSTLDEQPTVFIMKIDVTKKQRNRLVSLVIAQLYKELNKKARDNEKYKRMKDVKLQRPVYFLLDEFANLPEIHDVDTIFSYGRSIGLTMVPVVQDYAQLEEVYEKKGSIIKSQCNITVFIGTKDPETLKEVSEACGNVKYVEKSYSQGAESRAGGLSISTSARTKPLITTTELIALNEDANHPDKYGNTVVLQLNKYPAKLKVTPFFRAIDLYGMKKTDTEPLPYKKFDKKALYYDIMSSLNQGHSDNMYDSGSYTRVSRTGGSGGRSRSSLPERNFDIEDYRNYGNYGNYGNEDMMSMSEEYRQKEMMRNERKERERLENESLEKRFTQSIEEVEKKEKDTITNKEIKRRVTAPIIQINDIEKKLKDAISPADYEKYINAETTRKKLEALQSIIEKNPNKKGELSLILSELNVGFGTIQEVIDGKEVQRYFSTKTIK